MCAIQQINEEILQRRKTTFFWIWHRPMAIIMCLTAIDGNHSIANKSLANEPVEK